MKKHPSTALPTYARSAAGLLLMSLSLTSFAAGEQHPFPQALNYAGKITPNNVSQAQMNSTIASYYNSWKSSYVRPSSGATPGGGYYVEMKGTGGSGSEITTSEAHGYGMIIFALMAGYDAQAKQYFDGMYNMYNRHRSTGNRNLMSWVIDRSESTSKDSDSATDGDMDIAYSLLLAHYQWGSSGAINYLSEAKRIINNGLKGDDVHNSSKRTMLGDWDDDQWSTRASDWMTGHMRAYYDATQDPFWNQAADTVYNLIDGITKNYAPNTGLMPDFVVGSTPKPAAPNFLEAATDDDYSWNSCRYPWRIAMDAAHFNNAKARAAATKAVNWVSGATGGQPSGIMAGYRLNGSPLVGYSSLAFTAPFVAAATVASGDHQDFVNRGWSLMASKKEGYYSDSINLLSMLFISGNWWNPVAADSGTGGGGDTGGGDSGDGGGSTSYPAWKAGTQYQAGDIVQFNGKLYIAEHDNPGYDPTVSTWYWEPYTASGGGDTGGGGDNGDSDSQTGPYNGAPIALPGTLEAEHYDKGRFSDTTAGNSGGALRQDNVDIEPSSMNGYNIGWTAAGEWLEYTVKIASAGSYKVESLVASESVGGGFTLNLNGSKLASVNVPVTGGWQNWNWVNSTVTLSAGEHRLRITIDKAGFNLNALKFSRVDGGSPDDGSTGGGSPAIQVSASGDDGHIAQNVLDGSLDPESRWSSLGKGQWIEFDLGAVKTVQAMDIAFFKGSERRSAFSVATGKDRGSLKQIFSGQSSGNTLSLERFDLPDSEARYVRMTGNGNSSNDWNSLTEVKIVSGAGGDDDDDGDNTGGGDNNGGGGSAGNAVFSQGFESLAIGSEWLGMNDTEVRASCGVGSSKCLRVTYRPASNGSPRIQGDQALPPAKDYTLNYDIYFEPGFEFVKGGKLPGLAPKKHVTGCRDSVPDGWSLRVMWRREGKAQAYFYQQTRGEECGEGPESQSFKFQLGKWHAISARVKVNSGANTSDGLVELYMDGVKVGEQRNLQLRGSTSRDSEINKLFFSTFYGGSDSSWAPSKNTFIRFDNFAVYPGLRVRTAPGR